MSVVISVSEKQTERKENSKESLEMGTLYWTSG